MGSDPNCEPGFRCHTLSILHRCYRSSLRNVEKDKFADWSVDSTAFPEQKCAVQCGRCSTGQCTSGTLYSSREMCRLLYLRSLCVIQIKLLIVFKSGIILRMFSSSSHQPSSINNLKGVIFLFCFLQIHIMSIGLWIYCL